MCTHTVHTGRVNSRSGTAGLLARPFTEPLIAYLELQFRASTPSHRKLRLHFLVGSWPGGGSSRTPPAPQGVPPLPELTSETLSHVVPSVDVWSQEVNRSDNYRLDS